MAELLYDSCCKDMKSWRIWLNEVGVTPVTGWRWRKRRWIAPVNIYGRLYVTEAAVAEFNRRAEAGEFSRKHAVPIRKN